jgi:hypothetical protein
LRILKPEKYSSFDGVSWVGRGACAEVEIRTGARTVNAIQKSPKKPSKVLLVEDSAGDALLVDQALADCPTPVHLHIARDGRSGS